MDLLKKYYLSDSDREILIKFPNIFENTPDLMIEFILSRDILKYFTENYKQHCKNVNPDFTEEQNGSIKWSGISHFDIENPIFISDNSIRWFYNNPQNINKITLITLNDGMLHEIMIDYHITILFKSKTKNIIIENDYRYILSEDQPFVEIDEVINILPVNEFNEKLESIYPTKKDIFSKDS